MTVQPRLKGTSSEQRLKMQARNQTKQLTMQCPVCSCFSSLTSTRPRKTILTAKCHVVVPLSPSRMNGRWEEVKRFDFTFCSYNCFLRTRWHVFFVSLRIISCFFRLGTMSSGNGHTLHIPPLSDTSAASSSSSAGMSSNDMSTSSSAGSGTGNSSSQGNLDDMDVD